MHIGEGLTDRVGVGGEEVGWSAIKEGFFELVKDQCHSIPGCSELGFVVGRKEFHSVGYPSGVGAGRVAFEIPVMVGGLADEEPISPSIVPRSSAHWPVMDDNLAACRSKGLAR